MNFFSIQTLAFLVSASLALFSADCYKITSGPDASLLKRAGSAGSGRLSVLEKPKPGSIGGVLRTPEYLDAYNSKLSEIRMRNGDVLIKRLAPKSYDEDLDMLERIIKSEATHPLDKKSAMKWKRWGMEGPSDAREYWYNPLIHNFGNTGPLGAFAAVCAPIATFIIDNVAYSGRNIREDIADELKEVVGERPRVLDMCCGVGMSTRALSAKITDAETVIGLDTSPEFLGMGEFQRKVLGLKNFLSGRTSLEAGYQYVQGNAEKTGLPGKSFDLVTIMYAFHEAPKMGRYMMLREARRLLKPGGTLALIDISPDYTPSEAMLSGEPYVREYQANIHEQMESLSGFDSVKFRTVVDEHVGMWVLTRSEGSKGRIGRRLSEPWLSAV